MSLPWLNPQLFQFPHPSSANEYGVLAAGGDLSTRRLLLAYSWGIFPWYNEGEPIIWWHPDPRFVLFPENLKVHKSMRPLFNQQVYRVTYDHCFNDVITACAETPRRGQHGSWITDDMRQAYEQLHKQGHAHSVEVWQGDKLVGGLYGIAQGNVFFGESMFMRASNASKFGFIQLVRDLQVAGYELVDCQQRTRHLSSLGGASISRTHFLDLLEKNRTLALRPGHWREGVR